jgi:hypothetical protein
MLHNKAPQARLVTVAEFPPQYFLENLAVREDNSVLVHVANKKELWYVPPADGAEVVSPVHLHTYEENACGIVESEPDVFLLLTGNVYTTHESFLRRLDLRNWKAGSPIEPELICQFPERARGVNGCCLIGPEVVLVADCFAGLIWRIDLPANGGQPRFRVWLEHESMGYFPGKMKPEQPGVNGVRYAVKTNYLYYTATAKKLLMRVKVDPVTLEPAGSPELVVAGRMGDDFLIDEEAKVIYLTTHRQNTIDVVSMDPALNSGFTQCIAGDPYTEQLIGPSAGAWGRGLDDLGRIAYFITDGGTASPPPDGRARSAKLLRVELQPLTGQFPGESG